MKGTPRTDGGGCGIRTHGPREGSTVFKTAAIDHSAKPPDPTDSPARAILEGHRRTAQRASHEGALRLLWSQGPTEPLKAEQAREDSRDDRSSVPPDGTDQ